MPCMDRPWWKLSPLSKEALMLFLESPHGRAPELPIMTQGGEAKPHLPREVPLNPKFPLP